MSVETPLGADHPPLLRAVLGRQWRAVVIAVVVGAALGLVVGLAEGRSYRSTATVLIAPLEGVPYSPESVARQSQANTDALTDARLAATPAVARLVERSLGLPRNSLTWRSNLSVEVVPNSQVVKVGYRSSSPQRARQRAHAFSTEYLRYRGIRSQASVAGQLHSLESRARQVQTRLTAANHSLASQHTSEHRASLNQQVAIYTDQLAALSVQIAQLAAASRNPGQVLTPAGSPVATGVPTAAWMLIGAIAGLLVGLALAVVRESRDDRLRDASEVERAGLPLLATLAPPTSAPPDPEEVERYRTLRTAVLTHAPAPRVIEITSLSSTIPSGDVAAGLGIALARAGSDTTVVLASPISDPSRGARTGLAEVLLEDADAREARENVAPGLYLLEPGREIEAAAEMFAGEKLRTTLQRLARPNGYVLVAAPVSSTTASTALAVACDEVLLVTPLEESSVQDLTTALEEVQRLRGRVLGAVAVQGTPRESPRPRGVPSSLPRISRASVARWRALVSKPRNRGADTSAEGRLRALSTFATALERRIAQARSADAFADDDATAKDGGASPGGHSVEVEAAEDVGPPSDGEVEAAKAEGPSAPSRGREQAGTTKRGKPDS